MEKQQYDVIIIGCGLAGIYCALNLEDSLKVALISEGTIEDTNSFLAQGGIAAAITDKDSWEWHFEDTMSCGHNKSNPQMLKTLTQNAPEEIHHLESLGVIFDHNDDQSYMLGMEGAHRQPRILRIGDYTGKAIMETLWRVVQMRTNIHIVTDFFAYEVMTDEMGDSSVTGICNGDLVTIYASNVVYATGGMGHLFNRTSNGKTINGDGVAMAIKQGIHTRHLPWIQFHPTVFYNTSGAQEGFLISEAVRGDSAMLLNEKGERFMRNYHPLLELAPRDVVSSAILIELSKQSSPHVWLDVRHIGSRRMKMRFPTIYKYCKEKGLKLDTDLIPVAPGAHYSMGGISVDSVGKTNVDHVYAIGECSSTEVHGKNRLASNSLLEALVFSKITAKEISRMKNNHEKVIQIHSPISKQIPHYEVELKALSIWMDENMGIVKNYPEITRMKKVIQAMIDEPVEFVQINIEDIKCNNALIVMNEMLDQALQEKEDD